MTSQAPIADLVKQAYAAAAPGPSDVTDAAAESVYGFLFGALRGTPDPAETVGQAMTGIVAGSKQLGSALWHVARGALVGVVHAALGHRLEVEPLIRVATARLMTEADGLGADFGAAAQGAVEGSIVAAEELGLDPEDLGSTAAAAALETARELPQGAHARVQHLVTRRVMGFQITVPDDLRYG